jgi:hypothetical protein
MSLGLPGRAASTESARRPAATRAPARGGQVAHRHPERRVLVADACGALAPLVAPEMRPSLVLSMLAQLAADAEPAVRAAAAAALARLLPHLATLDKYPAARLAFVRVRAGKTAPHSVAAAPGRAGQAPGGLVRLPAPLRLARVAALGESSGWLHARGACCRARRSVWALSQLLPDTWHAAAAMPHCALRRRRRTPLEPQTWWRCRCPGTLA